MPPIETFSLANGLAVAVVPAPAAPVVSVQVWYRVGSKDDPKDRRGTAHAFQYLMFDGTQHVRAEQHAASLAALGGYVNAASDEDGTHFVDTLPSAYFDYAMQLEADRMRNLFLRPAAIDADRATIEDELRRAQGSPLTRGYLALLAAAFTTHPYATSANGVAGELAKTTPDELQKFYDAYYQPSNALVVVVGNVTVEQVHASADKWFGPIAKPAAEPPRPAKTASEPIQTKARVIAGEPGPVGLVLVGFHVPAAREADTTALRVATLVLGVGEGARLKRLEKDDPKTKKPVAVQTGVEAVVREDPGLAVAVAAFRDPKGDAAAIAGIADEIAKLAKDGPTPDELRRVKRQLQAQLVFGLESAQGFGEQVGRAWIQTGDAKALGGDYDRIEKVTADDVRRVVKQYFAPEKATTLVVPIATAPAKGAP